MLVGTLVNRMLVERPGFESWRGYKHVVEQRRLARAKEAREHRHWQRLLGDLLRVADSAVRGRLGRRRRRHASRAR